MDKGELAQVKVESLNYSAFAVGKADGLVVFINGGVPGDKLIVRITEIRKNYAVAEIVDIVFPSQYRCQPPCAHFTEGCGGCQWQHITYEYQLYWKKEIIYQALRRIGKLADLPEIELHRIHPFHYRNKLRLFPAKDMKPGMYKYGSHKVVPISECLIGTDEVNSLLNRLNNGIFSAESDLVEVSIRTTCKYKMLSCTYHKDNSCIKIDIDKLSSLSDVTSIFSRIGYKDFVLRSGKPDIMEEVCGIKYRIGPDSFFQVNIAGLSAIIGLVKEMAGKNRVVYDAHCGTGTFTLQLSDLSDILWGTDISPSVISLACLNAVDNNISNAHFIKGTAADVLAGKLRSAKIDLAILDPPKDGCEKNDLRALIRSRPLKVIYISCNPTTLARDLHELCKAGYRLLRLAMVDMFPMTYHLEVVGFLQANC